MLRFPCPYIAAEVGLSEERERHVLERHPDLLPEHRALVAQTFSDPDLVRRSTGVPSARLFSRWYTGFRGGKHVVVVVVSEQGVPGHHWVVTAYLARRITGGIVAWTRS